MKIKSSQRLLAQTVVTACGHVEEGPGADETEGDRRATVAYHSVTARNH
jgi:hypothetical protein